MENKKKAGVAILVSDKTDFKPTKIKKDKEGHYIMAKGSMQQEELTILNIYVPNTEAARFIKQVLRDLQRDLDSHTIIMGDFNTPLSTLDRSTRQKVNKDIQELNSTLHQADLIDIYRTLHPKSTEYTFFSAPHHTYSKIDHIVGSKALLSKCKRTEIITNCFSDHSVIKLELRIKKLTQHAQPTLFSQCETNERLPHRRRLQPQLRHRRRIRIHLHRIALPRRKTMMPPRRFTLIFRLPMQQTSETLPYV